MEKKDADYLWNCEIEGVNQYPPGESWGPGSLAHMANAVLTMSVASEEHPHPTFLDRHRENVFKR
jgi:hypothetical protein